MGAFDTKDPLGLEAAYHKKVGSSTVKEDPFGLEAALKKKVDADGSSSSNPSSSGESPSNIPLSTQLPFELQTLQKAGNDNPAPFTTVEDKKASQAAAPSDTPGFRKPDLNQPVAPVTRERIVKAFNIDPGKFAATQEPDEKGSYTDPTAYVAPLYEGVATISDAVNGVLKLGQSLDRWQASWDPTIPQNMKDYILKNDNAGVKALNSFSEWMREPGQEHQLPNTFTGQAIHGMLATVPVVAATVASGGETSGALIPEGAGSASGFLTSNEILQNALTKGAGPLTRYLGAQGLGEGLNKGYDESGGQILPTLMGGVKGTTEGIESGLLLEGQMGAGNEIGAKLFDFAKKSGVVSGDGIITEQALKSLIGSPTAFATASVAQDLANGRPVDWQNAGISAVTALPFEFSHLVEAYDNAKTTDEKKAALNANIDKVINVLDNNAVVNFASATPDEIVKAMQRPETAAELQVQSLAKGVQAQNTDTYAEKNALHLEQIELQQQSDLKRLGETVVTHGVNKFADAINETSLPDDIKEGLLAKAHGINQEFNPVAIEQENKQAKVEDLNTKIDDIQSVPGATDPVKNPAGVADLINMVDKRTDLQVELLDKAIDNPSQLAPKYKRTDIGGSITPGLGEPIDGSNINQVFDSFLYDKLNDNSTPETGIWSKESIRKELTRRGLPEIEPEDNEQAKIQTENEASAAPEQKIEPETGNQQSTNLGGGFQFKSKEHGTLNIIPEENNEYTVHFEDGQVFKGTPEEIRMALPDFDESKIGADETTSKLHGTDDPKEIASMYDAKRRELLDTGSKEGAIAAYGPRTNAETFGQTNDLNNITGGIRLNYFKNKNGGTPALDVQADEINRQYFNGADVVHPNDIAEFMIKYPGGERSYSTPSGNAELKQIADRYKDVTGNNLTSKTAEKLARKYSNVSEPEIRDIQERFDSPQNTEKVKQFIDDQLSTPGLHGTDEILEKLSAELDRYIADPNNQFNLFHDVYQGDILSEEEIKSIKNEIENTKNEQLAGDTNGEEPADQTGSETPVGEESKRGQPEPVTEDDLPFQRGAGEPIPQERIDAIQGLMKKVFPNVETEFHPSVESFADAAKQNGINATDPPNAFVDKSGKIHFNPDSIHADTQIHEYGHILTGWAKENAPTLYNRMIAFGRDASDIHKELTGNGYKLSPTRMAEEAFVTILGRHGEGKLDEVIKNSGTRGTISKFINDLWTRFQRYLIDKTGFDISRFKNIKDMPINEFLDTINQKYLLSDTKISDIGTKEYSQVDEQKSGRPVKMEGEGMADYFKRVIEWTKEQQTGQKAIDFEKANEPQGAEFELEADKYKPGYNFSETSIKNRQVAVERRARFLDEVESVNKRDFGTVWERGKQMVDNGEVDPKVLADNIIQRPRPLSAEETAALTYDRMRLYNDHQTTMDQIIDAMESNNPALETEARARLAYIEDRINTNDIAAKQAGYEQGLGLAARRMIAAQDYSLANQIQLAKVANGGKELPEDVRTKLEDLSRRLQEAEKKLADYEANSAERAAKLSLARLKKEAELEQRTERKQKRTQSKEQIQKNIENIKSSIFEKIGKNKGLTSSVIPYADKLAEITPDLARLAKEYIKSGIVTVEGIVDLVHADIKDHLEGITKRDVRDAISGYGRTSKPSKDEIEAQLRELKSQARLTSALEDAQAGQRPLKSGYTREKPSDAVRELQKQVHDAMRENGIEVQRDPISEEDAWKTALESVKTRLRNQITDLNKQIETGIKPEKKGRIIYDQEANDLKAERDRLQKSIDETEGNKELTDEQRVEILTKTTEKSIEEYKKRIEDLKTNGRDTVAEEKAAKRDKLKDLIESTPELKALKERLSELQDEHAKIIDEAKPKRTPEEVALDAFKKRMTNKIAELEKRIADNDYSPKPKKELLPLDEEGKALRAQVRRIQRQFDENREKLRLANRTALEKRLDWAAKYRRFILLSNITTLAKLSAAGATRLITSPLEEVAGHGLSLVPGINKISSMAPREGGGLSIKAEAESLAKVLSRNSINEMIRTIREGKSSLDERVDQKEKTFKEGGFFELPGQIHAALKTVPKQVEYYRSLQKRIEWALRNGYDITSPDVQTSLQVESFKDQYPELFTGKTVEMSALEYQAFQDGKRAIFMQDNFLSDEWTAMIKRWENKGPKGVVAATIARIFLPIIKIPTNFVAESSSLAFGGVKAVFALRNGIDKLTPDEADYVMRALKKQSVGAAFFALGYFLPNYVGGFYRKDEKRKKGSPEADDLVIMGEKVPHWLMHAPVFEVLQMGATVRRVHDQYAKNSKISTGDEVVTSSLAAGKGLFGQVPMFGEAADLTRGLETAESLKKFSANFVLGLVAPYDVQRVAKWMDEDSHGNVIKRKEKGFIQHLESGIPVVRSHELKRK